MMATAAVWLAGIILPSAVSAQDLSAVKSDLLKCQRSVTKEATKASGAAAKVYRKVLDASVKDYYTTGEISEKTAESATTTLRKLSDSRGLGSSIEEKTEERIISACDPSTHAFTNEDLLGLPGGTAPQPLNAKQLEPLSATTLGAPGTIESVVDLAKTITRVAVTEVVRPIITSSPNGGTILSAVKTKVEVLPPPPDDPTKTFDAIAILDSAKYLVDSDGDGVLDPKILLVDVITTTTTTTSTSSTATTVPPTTTSTSSTTTTTIFVPNVCGNGVWEVGEACDPASPQAGPGCESDCTCNPFTAPCNYF